MLRYAQCVCWILVCWTWGSATIYSQDLATPALPSASSAPPVAAGVLPQSPLQTVNRPIVTLELEYSDKKPARTTTGVFIDPEQYLIAVIPLDDAGQAATKISVRGRFLPTLDGNVPLTAKLLARDAATAICLLHVELRSGYRYVWSSEKDIKDPSLSLMVMKVELGSAPPTMTRQQLNIAETSDDQSRLRSISTNVLDNAPKISDIVLNGQKLRGLQLFTSQENEPPVDSFDPVMTYQGEIVGLALGCQPKSQLVYVLPANQVAEVVQRLCTGLNSTSLPRPLSADQAQAMRRFKLPPELGLLDFLLDNGDHVFNVVPFIDQAGHFLVMTAYVQELLPSLGSVTVYRDGQRFEIGSVRQDEETGVSIGSLKGTILLDSHCIDFTQRVNYQVGDVATLPKLRDDFGPGQTSITSLEVETRDGSLSANSIIRVNSILRSGQVLYRNGQVLGLVLGQDESNRGGSIVFPAPIVAGVINRLIPKTVTKATAKLPNAEDVGTAPSAASVPKIDPQLDVETQPGPPVTPSQNHAQEAQNLELDRQAKELAQKFKGTEGPEQPAIREELEKLTAMHFELRQTLQQRELQGLESRLEKLKETMRQRGQLRAAIIHKRVDDLLEVKTPLDWETTPARANISRLKMPEPDHPPVSTRPSDVTELPPPDSNDRLVAERTFNIATPMPATDSGPASNPLTPVPPTPQSLPQRAQNAIAFNGSILTIDPEGIAEISAGSDDGLQLGQNVDVYSYEHKQYAGRLEVVALLADRATCKPVPGTRQAFMQQNDDITVDLSTAPKAAISNPDLAALQGMWIQQVPKQELAKAADDNQNRWLIDGRLFIVTNQYGRARFRGVLNLGQTRKTKFIQIRELVDYGDPAPVGAPELPSSDGQSQALSVSLCFLYRTQGDKWEIQGFMQHYSPSTLPSEFGGPDQRGQDCAVMTFHRSQAAAPVEVDSKKESTPMNTPMKP
jgi:hypothetical protein